MKNLPLGPDGFIVNKILANQIQQGIRKDHTAFPSGFILGMQDGLTFEDQLI